MKVWYVYKRDVSPWVALRNEDSRPQVEGHSVNSALAAIPDAIDLKILVDPEFDTQTRAPHLGRVKYLTLFGVAAEIYAERTGRNIAIVSGSYDERTIKQTDAEMEAWKEITQIMEGLDNGEQ